MSEQAVNTAIDTLTQIHEELLRVSKEKTEVLKHGNTDALQTILATERKYTRQLDQAEQQRQKAVQQWFDLNAPGEETTVTNMLEYLPGEKSSQLEQETVSLVNTITALKQQEQLNRSLLQQSQQFVQMSLDVMQPSLSNMNYGQRKDAPADGRSVFDSKV